jgi:hypothetical protein
LITIIFGFIKKKKMGLKLKFFFFFAILKKKFGGLNMSGALGERLARLVVQPALAVRPLPPPLEGVANFTPGDLVECCHSFSWKTAKILKAVTDNIFLVRLLGVSDVGFIAHKSFLRVRQLWTGAEWYVLGKNSTTSMCACAKENDEDSESVASTSTTYGSCNSSTEEEEEEGNESEEYSPSTFGALLPTYPWEFTVIFFFSIFFFSSLSFSEQKLRTSQAHQFYF